MPIQGAVDVDAAVRRVSVPGVEPVQAENPGNDGGTVSGGRDHVIGLAAMDKDGARRGTGADLLDDSKEADGRPPAACEFPGAVT